MTRDLTEEEWNNIRMALLAASAMCSNTMKAVKGKDRELLNKKRHALLELAERIAA